jgi:hypothetical protein
MRRFPLPRRLTFQTLWRRNRSIVAHKRKPDGRRPSSAGGPARSSSSELRARKIPDENIWELVHPRCARDRSDDLDEVQKMIEGGEAEIARDELLWLLNGCSDCLAAHKMLGEMALADHDLPLARGHFGYAFEIGSKALERAGAKGAAPYRLPANQAFFEAGKGLAYCLRELSKADLAAQVVARLLACDPSDPLGIRGMLDKPGSEPVAGSAAPVDG